MIEYQDLVEITMPDDSVKQGVVQGTYDGNDGLFIFHPEHGNMHWGVYEGDLKSQGAVVETIEDSEADFRLDLYRN